MIARGTPESAGTFKFGLFLLGQGSRHLTNTLALYSCSVGFMSSFYIMSSAAYAT